MALFVFPHRLHASVADVGSATEFTTKPQLSDRSIQFKVEAYNDRGQMQRAYKLVQSRKLVGKALEHSEYARCAGTEPPRASIAARR